MSKDAAVNLSTFFTETFRIYYTNEVIEQNEPTSFFQGCFSVHDRPILPQWPLKHFYKKEGLFKLTGNLKEASLLTWTWMRKVSLFMNTFASIFVCFLRLLTGSFKCSSSSGLARSLSTRVQFCHSDSTPAHIRNEVALKAAAALASSSMLVV